MGLGPVSFQEIDAWRRLSGVRLTPWEARTLRNLSREYAAELKAAESPTRLSPFATVTTDQQKNDVAMELRRQMRAAIADDDD